MNKILANVRRFLALMIFALLLWLFIDATGLARHLAFLSQWQFIPSLLAGSLGILFFIIIFTLLFGRWYCSVLCPFGILQDVILRLLPKRKFKYLPNPIKLRYTIFALFLIFLIFSLPLLVGILEPYSAFARIAACIFAPIWYFVQALLGKELADPSPYLRGDSAFLLASITLIVIIYFVLRNGRTWCNNICPVGTLLGFLQSISPVAIQFQHSNCRHCKCCELVCKTSCIDSAKEYIDHSRCVNCFRCLESCKHSGLTYSYRGLTSLKSKDSSSQHSLSTNSLSQNIVVGNNLANNNLVQNFSLASVTSLEVANFDRSRRYVLASLLGTLGLSCFSSQIAMAAMKDLTAPIPAKLRRARQAREVLILPPGAKNLAHYQSHCTGCQLCVRACPSKVLFSADQGANTYQPALTYEYGYCRPDCHACAKICPTQAISQVKQKQNLQIGLAKINLATCVVNTDHLPCRACINVCPTQCISLIEANQAESSNGLAYPVVDSKKCIGCGFCEYVCPARPLAAIQITGLVTQQYINLET